MTVARPALGLLALALVLGAPVGAGAQYPVPRVREWPEALEAAFRHFESGRWVEAVDAFEQVGREGRIALPPEALRRWGLAASEGGRPLAAYLRLRQYLATRPPAPDRDAAVDRVDRAREALLAEAARFSRLLAAAERRPDAGSPGERHIVRMAARDGEVSLEGLSGLRAEAPLWRRAEEIPTAPYLGLLRRLIDLAVVGDDLPAPRPGPHEPGPGRTAVVRLVIGEEERRLEAEGGEPYERLRQVVGAVLDFARAVPAMPAPPDPEAKAPPPPQPKPAAPRPGKRRP